MASLTSALSFSVPHLGCVSGAAPESLSASGQLGPPQRGCLSLLFAESSGGREAGACGQGEGAPGLGLGLEAERARQDGCCQEQQRAGRHREVHLRAAGKHRAFSVHL